MQRKMMPMIVAVVAVTLLTWFNLLLKPGDVSADPTKILPLSASPIASPSSSSSGSAQGLGDFNPVILAALIGLVGVVVGSLITGSQQRRTERKRLEEQFRHDQEIARLQREHDQEMARLQKELEAQYKAKEQEEQHEATKAEALRLKMLLDQTNSERAKTYRQALHADPRISHLQILDMSRPLEVTNIYVRVRIHQDARTGYELDPIIRAAEAQRDPNALLLAGFRFLEQRVSSAIDPDEAICTYKHCIIVGDPGAGKTTLLKFLTLKASDGQLTGLPDFPIRIELNAFVNSGHQDLLDFAAAEWDERYGFPKADARIYMEERLQAGEALLLLDALDETMIGDSAEAAEASYLRVANAIMLATTRYHHSPIVVTARKAGYQQRAKLVGFTELEVLDFRPDDIRQFVNNWFNSYQDAHKRANAIDLNTKLERTPRIQALAANPLLLSLIVLVYEAQLDLPDRRAELYKRCVDTLLTEWDGKRNIRRRREFKPEHKRQLLAEIAWHFHQQGRRYFPENEVLAVIAGFLPKIRLLPEQNGQVLAEIANEQGLLKEQARGWQGFLHLTLQEYFVAQYVTDHRQLDTLLAHRNEPWWEEVLLLYVGYTPDASLILQRLLVYDDKGRLEDDLFQTNLLLAGQCLTARPTIQDIALWEKVISQLFLAFTETPYSLTRENIAKSLASIGGSEVNRRLVKLLADEQVDASVRDGIAQALGELGERSVVPDLMRLLADEQVDASVRDGIAQALGELGEHSVVPDLMQLLANKQVGASVRSSIVIAIGALGERSVASDLMWLLSSQRDTNQLVLWNLTVSLTRLGERSVVPDLMRLLADEQVDSGLRQRIAECVGGLGERSVVPDLMRLLADEQTNLSVRGSIAYTLCKLGERSVVPDLMRLLANKQVEGNARLFIAQALGKLGEHSVVPDLMRLLADEQVDASVRRGIAQALGMLTNDDVSFHRLAALLLTSDIPDDIHRALWTVSRRVGATIISSERQARKQLEVVKW